MSAYKPTITPPKQHIIAKIFIVMECIVIIGYAFIIAMLAYWGVADNPPENRVVHITMPMVIFFATGLAIQAVHQIIRLNSVDHYLRHIAALSIIIASPVVGLVIASNAITSSFDPIMLVPCFVGIAGLVWQTILLSSKHAASSSWGKTAVTVETARKRKQAYLFILVPIIGLVGIALINSLWQGFMNIDFLLSLAFSALRDVVSWLSIPSVVAGIILLIRLRKT